jgi:imidazolonepropionase-like amidohydrolase
MMKKKIPLLAAALLCCWFMKAQETYPRNDIAFSKNDCYAFTNVTLVKDAQTTLPNATLVIRKGVIVQAGPGAPPPDAVVIDCKGKYIYPSFIDPYSDYGAPAMQRSQGGGFNFGNSQMLSNTKGAFGWNAAIKAEADFSKIFQVNETRAKELRNNGFGVVGSHIPDGIVRGSGVVASLANVKENMALLKDRATAHYSFNKGSSTQDYPNSLMGCITLLRQTYLDAQWYKTKPAKEGTNLSLQGFNDLQSLPQFFESNDKWTDLRAARVAKEFGANYVILTGANGYQRIADLKATGASFIVPLNFPAAMDVEDPNDARFVGMAEMKHWEMAPGNPGVFEKAGINFALTQYGLRDASAFMANLRKALQNGLSETKALEALTKIPAALLGMSQQIGSLDAGKLANFIITSGPVFSEKTVIYQNWIQGMPYILKEDGWKDYRATYNLTINNQPYQLEVNGDAAKPGARLLGKDTLKADLKLNDKLVNLSFALKQDSGKVTRLGGVNMGDSWSGTGQLANGQWVKWGATRAKDFVAKSDSSKRDMAKKVDMNIVPYPFNGYGNTELPKANTLLIKNATVWTSDKQGKLLNTDVLVQNGKIASIGKNLSATGATIVDGTGKHLTAGIIDEHSHIAATGSINECSQSVTAEVRIGDVVNPDDVNIYRQLSGGVTAVHILHGSCNTIGGQTQLIKLRWGRNAEEMKFAGWDGFIKFALGENVKRSAAQQSNRYPDTRMGVEQLLEDAFARARDYEKQGANKRRDLELETILEILNSKRFITCHSYVQSEIVALMRIAEKYGFKVNTFTHILEGYKVADKMKQHGAAASTFSDWWAYKMEVIDAIPQNPYLMQQQGLNVAINSDDAEMARRLNQEAAKSVKYAGMNEEEALKMVTINPATMLHVGDRTGSITVGKDADLVLWSAHPLSIYAMAEKTLVDGIIYFDRAKDLQARAQIAKEKNRLTQKMLAAKKGGERTGPATPSFMEVAECELDHSHGKDLWHRIEKRMEATGASTATIETDEQ